MEFYKEETLKYWPTMLHDYESLSDKDKKLVDENSFHYNKRLNKPVKSYKYIKSYNNKLKTYKI